MYNPHEARKPFFVLLKENGVTASLKSGLFVILLYFFCTYVSQEEVSLSWLLAVYFFFCIYFTWKPKLIRFLRGVLRGKDFRDKSDD